MDKELTRMKLEDSINRVREHLRSAQREMETAGGLWLELAQQEGPRRAGASWSKRGILCALQDMASHMASELERMGRRVTPRKRRRATAAPS